MRRLLGFSLSLFLAIAVALPASAAPRPPSIPLPVDFAPEGIAVGTGQTFYVGSLIDGDIYRGDLRSGTGSVFIDFEMKDGRVAAGMRVDEGRHRLFVAGGTTGYGYVYDTRDGSAIAELMLGPPGTTFANDVALTRHAAYFTDTFQAKIYKVPLGPGDTFGVTQTINVTGDVSDTQSFGLNGIDATKDGRLLVNHTSLGILAVVDPNTGASTTIPLSGPALAAGTLDGLQLEGRTAWVVQNFANSVAKVELAPDLSAGRVVDVVTSDLFRVPATMAVHGSRIVLVNARFDLGFPPPFGPGAPPETDFDVVQLKP